jgi:hypothetical protein
MKVFALCAVMCVGAFVAMGYQAGLFDERAVAPRAEPTGKPEPKKTAPPAEFPDALVDACNGRPVPQAAEYKPGDGPFRVVFFDTQGEVHAWQEQVAEEWLPDTVEGTHLVAIVGKNYKKHIERILYPNNAPPVDRWRFDMDVQVVAAKTGETLTKQRFVSLPRQVSALEDWDLTGLGGPVPFPVVFDWLKQRARHGFATDQPPITTTYRNN